MYAAPICGAPMILPVGADSSDGPASLLRREHSEHSNRVEHVRPGLVAPSNCARRDLSSPCSEGTVTHNFHNSLVNGLVAEVSSRGTLLHRVDVDVGSGPPILRTTCERS